MTRRMSLMAGGGISLALSLLLAIAVLGGLSAPETAARTPQVTPQAPSCNLHGYRNDAAQADFRNPHKESPGAIGPELLPRRTDTEHRQLGNYDYDVFKIKDAFWGLMCGSSARRPNSLAALGVLTALNGGRIPHFSSKKAQAAAVEALMNKHYDQENSARGTACGEDNEPYRTVYATDRDGHLRLGLTTVRRGRWSCYTTARFIYGSVVRLIDLRMECLQATATQRFSPSAGPGGWYDVSIEPQPETI